MLSNKQHLCFYGIFSLVCQFILLLVILLWPQWLINAFLTWNLLASFQVWLLPPHIIQVVEVKISFMSEEAITYLELIGLLGEYCPVPRKKNFSSLRKIDCMHLGFLQEYIEFHSCNTVQHCTAFEEESHSLKLGTSWPWQNIVLKRRWLYKT